MTQKVVWVVEEDLDGRWCPDPDLVFATRKKARSWVSKSWLLNNGGYRVVCYVPKETR